MSAQNSIQPESPATAGEPQNADPNRAGEQRLRAASLGVMPPPSSSKATGESAGAAISQSNSLWAASRGRGSRPLPQRPKGRIFVAVLLLGLIGLPGYSLWNARLRYPVRGVVSGRVIQVSPPWAGTLATVHVREDEEVRQGQVLLTIESVELEQQIEEIGDQLKLAQAELTAHVVQLVWESQLRGDRSQKAQAEYYESWGRLLEERAKLDLATMERERHEATHRENSRAISQRQVDAAGLAEQGQKAKLRMLEESVDELKTRTELYGASEDSPARLSPYVLRIETLQAALTRVRQRLAEGQIRSPVNGRVVKLLRFTGEFANQTDPIVEIVEQGSVEVVLFLPQKRANRLVCGDRVHVHVEPFNQAVPCCVERRGNRLETPPANIVRHYAKHEKLIPIYLEPRWPLKERHAFLGSEVKVPWHALTTSQGVLGTARTVPVPASSASLGALETGGVEIRTLVSRSHEQQIH